MVADRIKTCQAHLDRILVRYLPSASTPSPLFSAMHYACLNGGKRLRPLLAYMTAEIFGAPPLASQLDPIASAIEFIHCYSLVHDDLPAMDNDDLRRGKPTCHKVYGEAMAILAGDALLTLAFELLANAESVQDIHFSAHLKIIQKLAEAAGAQGMIQGQALDMAAEIAPPSSIEALNNIHRTKTGALIAASVQCGALATQCATENDLVNLQKFGQSIGLAFQIQDDILDILGDSHIMGKNAGQDVKNKKYTYVTFLGLERAQQHAQHYYQEALAHLDAFGSKANDLRALSAYMIERVQ